jgi:hypothetical protein
MQRMAEEHSNIQEISVFNSHLTQTLKLASLIAYNFNIPTTTSIKFLQVYLESHGHLELRKKFMTALWIPRTHWFKTL